MKRYTFHSAAEKEYTGAANYYLQIDPQLAVRFFDEIERLICEVRTQPQRFRIFDAPARRHFSNVFPYALLFVDQPDRILILAVMHMKRRPGYWHGRLG